VSIILWSKVVNKMVCVVLACINDHADGSSHIVILVFHDGLGADWVRKLLI